MKARVVPATSRKITTASSNGRGPAIQAPLIKLITESPVDFTFTLNELATAVNRVPDRVQAAMAKIVAEKKIPGLKVLHSGHSWLYERPSETKLNFPPEPDATHDGAFTKKQSATIASLMDPYAPGEKIEILVVGRTSDGTVILELPTGELIRTRA